MCDFHQKIQHETHAAVKPNVTMQLEMSVQPNPNNAQNWNQVGLSVE